VVTFCERIILFRNGFHHRAVRICNEYVFLNGADIYGSCTDDTNSGCLRSGANGDIPPVASAVLTTVDSFSFKYGRVLVRAKLAAGDWLWPGKVKKLHATSIFDVSDNK
jgi:hypothetical protein